MGRSFANLHMKSDSLERSIEAFRALATQNPDVLGLSDEEQGQADLTGTHYESDKDKLVLYISQTNKNWVSVLQDFFVWGTVKRIGESLSRLVSEPVVTVGFIHDEIFELSVFKDGEMQAERIFCEEWTRSEYGLQEERLHDDHLREALDIPQEEMDELIKITSPAQAVDKLTELTGLSLWSDWEWVPHEEGLRSRFAEHEISLAD
ncbi:hypothetical protein D3P07_26535 [Paenibacillus sp. 1011MAR3C5]|uniref:hypothetical protein n=1 Tax=Paenibacillus sp. 1011MAR3C5 TaxID=1675787 RepID=UPI000E6BDD8E|nr:hypothetical protein [Paenibacillus sp. 1011MAR3C5]RJE82613.1 hypothetical protein D3P07_26535 [Paenibacillus sp. 1011MAR3C5]